MGVITFSASGCSPAYLKSVDLKQYENKISAETFVTEYEKSVEKYLKKYIYSELIEEYDEEAEEMTNTLILDFIGNFKATQFCSGWENNYRDGKQIRDKNSIDETSFVVDSKNHRAQGTVISKGHSWDGGKDIENDYDYTYDYYLEKLDEDTIKINKNGELLYFRESWYGILKQIVFPEFLTLRQLQLLNIYEFTGQTFFDEEGNGFGNYYKDGEMYTIEYKTTYEEDKIQIEFSETEIRITNRLYGKAESSSGKSEKDYCSNLVITDSNESVEQK